MSFIYLFYSEDNVIMVVGDDGDKYIRAATLNKLIIKLTNENDHGLCISSFLFVPSLR